MASLLVASLPGVEVTINQVFGFGVFVFDTTPRVAFDVFEGFRQVSGQLTPKTIRPGRLAPKSTNLTMFLLFVFYRGFPRTIHYYMFLTFTSFKRFSAVLKFRSEGCHVMSSVTCHIWIFAPFLHCLIFADRSRI